MYKHYCTLAYQRNVLTSFVPTETVEGEEYLNQNIKTLWADTGVWVQTKALQDLRIIQRFSSPKSASDTMKCISDVAYEQTSQYIPH